MIEIREALPDDALGITIVNVYTWKTTYAGLMPDELIDARIGRIAEIAARRRAEIEAGRGFLVAETEHAIVGFCMYGKSGNEDYPDAGEIYGLYVLKGFQGAGAGKRLFREARQRLAAQGRPTLIVNCLAGNPARGFYESMGGVVAGQRQDRMGEHAILEDILYFANPTA